jgi:RHS repeat-associated protein
MHNVRQDVFGNAALTSSTYSAFGRELYTSSTYSKPYYRYQGAAGLFRDLSNYYYAINRFVDTTKGRWISRDPIGFDGGDWNLFRLMDNNPVDVSDPSGLSGRSAVIHTNSASSYQITIKFNSLIKPGPNACGPVYFKTNWHLPKGARDGFIVQHNIITVRTGACKYPTDPPYTSEFWEAWEVKEDNYGKGIFKLDIEGNGEDDWDLNGLGGTSGYGNIHVESEAAYIEGWSPPSNWTRGGDILSHDSYSIETVAAPYDWPGGAVKHSMIWWWCCCGSRPSSGVTTVPSAPNEKKNRN